MTPPLPAVELISLVVEVVHLRQAGVLRATVENQIVQTYRLPRHSARRLIGQVEHELVDARRKMGLPLALSAESLLDDCVEKYYKGGIERN
jgi:hypothetical protein